MTERFFEHDSTDIDANNLLLEAQRLECGSEEWLRATKNRQILALLGETVCRAPYIEAFRHFFQLFFV